MAERRKVKFISPTNKQRMPQEPKPKEELSQEEKDRRRDAVLKDIEETEKRRRQEIAKKQEEANLPFDQTHTRKTIYFENRHLERLEALKETERRSITRLVNEALTQYLRKNVKVTKRQDPSK